MAKLQGPTAAAGAGCIWAPRLCSYLQYSLLLVHVYVHKAIPIWQEDCQLKWSHVTRFAKGLEQRLHVCMGECSCIHEANFNSKTLFRSECFLPSCVSSRRPECRVWCRSVLNPSSLQLREPHRQLTHLGTSGCEQLQSYSKTQHSATGQGT